MEERIYIPDSKGYYLVNAPGTKAGWKVWSEYSKRYLKNTTRYGRTEDMGDNATYGVSFYGKHGDSIQEKLSMRYLKKICGI